jgi:predicted TIM-barrel fold metal-dependent hydrolase
MYSSDRYLVISADCHGGSHPESYRNYLDPAYRDDFDRWAETYEPPYEDLKGADGSRNWDSGRRLRELSAEGIAAEVLFPNTVPPFFPTSSLSSQIALRDADDLQHRWAGLRAHNRWLVDFCAAERGRRAGVFQVMLHDIKAAVEEVRWAAAAGLTGGVLLAGAPPGSGLPPLYYHDYYGPLWQACAEMGIPVNCHSGSAAPHTGDRPEDHVLFMLELSWWDHRVLRHLILGGVLEENPDLTVVFTEQGLGWIPNELKAMDGFFDSARGDALVQSELTFTAQVAQRFSLRPSEYFQRQCYVGASFMSPAETRIRHLLGHSKLMWGSDYPHTESTYPYSKAAIRLAYADLAQDEVEAMLGGTAARVFGFNLDLLRPIAERIGPLRAEVAAGIDPATLPGEAAKSPAFAGLITGSPLSRWADNRKTSVRTG